MRPGYPNAPRPVDRAFSLVYLGIMGPQDNVDLLLDVMEHLVHKRGRTEIHATLLGFGDCLKDLRRRTTELELDNWVTFTGRADRNMIADHLSVADVGLSPDLKTPLNDVSTMNKTMEYMAYALPSVSFDLVETQVSGGDAVIYVPSGDVEAFADAVEELLDNPALRLWMAKRARARVAQELDWGPQARAYVGVFNELIGTSSEASDTQLSRDAGNGAGVDVRGRAFVDLTDAVEFDRFILERSQP
jgi:glycosyltransferase involved in cell wall biosynthesis